MGEKPQGRTVTPVKVVNGPLNPIPVTPGSPGTTITTEPDAVVGIGATVALTAPPALTRAMTVQNTGSNSTTQIRVREVGGPAGAGDLLIQFGSAYFTVAVAQLEVEEVAGVATTVALQFEGP